MDRLTMRDLSRETAAVLDKVERGETIEVTRGGRVVAKVVPAGGDDTATASWREHVEWFEQVASQKRRGEDPVDELLRSRRRR